MFEAPDNPFAIRPQSRCRSLVASFKGLFIVAALLIAVLVAQSQTRQWLLARWLSGMSALPAEQQIARLKQIHALGDLATESLTQQIAAADPAVAATAYELIRERQSAWSLRDDEPIALAHGRMLSGLAAVVDELPPDRLPWVTELINQTILECVDQRGEAMQQTYATANALASRLATESSTAANRSLAAADRDRLPPPSLVPLPVRMQSLAGHPSAPQSPPHREPAVPADAPATPALVTRPEAEPVAVSPARSPRRWDPARGTQHEATSPKAATGTLAAAASQPAETLQAVHRVATEEPQPPTSVEEAAAAPKSQPLELTAERPLRTLSTRRVIDQLASKQAAAADQAAEELTHRGLSKEEIRIASQLAAPQVEVRLGLLQSLLRRTDIDARPWLLWLAEDSEQDVRLQAVTALAALDDAAVQQALRKRLGVEADPVVAAQLRNVVDRR